MKLPLTFHNHEGELLKGHFWPSEKPIKNLIIVTGMQEYSDRYDNFATFMANNGFNVYCLDYYGQGENVDDGIYGKVPEGAFLKMADNIYELGRKLTNESNLPLYAFGHSMGSFITQAYIETHRNIAEKVVLCGTCGRMGSAKAGLLMAKLLVNHKNAAKPSPFFTKLSVGGYSKGIKNKEFDCDWLSYNRENREKYSKDPKDQYIPSKGFYKELFKGINMTFKKAYMKNVPPEVELFIIAGDADPVNKNGKKVVQLYKLFKKYGHDKVSHKIYPHMRHEILNEDNKMDVYNDILNFFNSKK